MFLLAVYTTVYIYVQPYKSNVTNLVEAAVNVHFLLLLVLNATSFFRDDYLTFPTPMLSANVTGCSNGASGIATVSWILMPFYYLPLLCLFVAFLFLTFIFTRYTLCYSSGACTTCLYNLCLKEEDSWDVCLQQY